MEQDAQRRCEISVIAGFQGEAGQVFAWGGLGITRPVFMQSVKTK